MARGGLPPVQAAYLRLAGWRAAGAAAEVAAAVGAGVTTADDWATLRALARHDGVSAPLWAGLEAAGVRPPPEVAEAMRREARVAEFGAARLEQRLRDALGLLEAAGVRPVLLKGAGLAYSAYGGFAGRPMSDLDLLVAPDQLAGASAALRAAGWRPERAADARYAAHQHEMPLVSPDGGAVVELHRELLPGGHPFALDGAGMRAAARPVRAPWGAEVLVPAAADQLVHCCVHFAWSHELRWGAWRTFADVAALLPMLLPAAEGEPAAEDEPAVEDELAALVARVEAARAGCAVYWTLRLAAAAGGVAVPPALLGRLAPSLSPRRASWLARHYAQQLVRGGAAVPSVTAGRLLWRWGMRPDAGGHPGARPWAHAGVTGTPAASGDGAGAAGPARARRLLRQLGRLWAWRRWWRATRAGSRSGRGGGSRAR